MLEKTTNSYAGHFRDPRTALIEPAAATRGRGAYQPRLRLRLPAELKGAVRMWMRFSPIAYGFGNARDTRTGTFRTDNAVV